MKKIVSLIALICVFLFCFAACAEPVRGNKPQPPFDSSTPVEKQEKYAPFFALIDQKEYEAAYEWLNQLGNDEGAQMLKGRFYYLPIGAGQDTQTTWTYNQDHLPIQITYVNYQGELIVWDYTYDGKGNLTKQVFTEGGKIDSIVEYVYDDNNLVIQYVHTNCAIDLTSVVEYEFEYDANGNETKQTCTVTSSGITKKNTLEYTYDANGNMLKHISTDNEGKTFIYEWAYDENGNKTKYLMTNKEGKTSSDEFFYDAQNRLTKNIHRAPGGGGYDREIFYDDHDNVIKEITTTTSGNVSEEVWQFTYDENGNIIKSIYIDSARRQIINESTYDESGRLIKEVTTSYINGTTVTDYTYDAMGREIKQVIVNSSIGTNIFENAYDENGNHIRYYHTAPNGKVEQWFREYKFVYIPYDLSEISEKTREIFATELYRE